MVRDFWIIHLPRLRFGIWGQYAPHVLALYLCLPHRMYEFRIGVGNS
jgi:hypothetical protein